MHLINELSFLSFGSVVCFGDEVLDLTGQLTCIVFYNKQMGSAFTRPLWRSRVTGAKSGYFVSISCGYIILSCLVFAGADGFRGPVGPLGPVGNRGPSGKKSHDDVIKWKHFRVTVHLCGEFPGEFPAQRPVTRSFDVFFDLRLNKRLSKQGWGWWFETPLHPLWRHCDTKSFSVWWHYNKSISPQIFTEDTS